MNKKIVTLAALLSLGLAACGPTDSTSSSSPVDTGSSSDSTSEVKPQTTYTAVTIDNKIDFAEPWYVATPENRTLTITTSPAAVPANLLNEGRLTVTSSDPTIVSTIGLNATPKKAGKATLTVTVTNPDGASVTDSFEVVVKEAAPASEFGPHVVSTLAEGSYQFGFSINGADPIFATGEMSGFYGATVPTTKYNVAATFKLAANNGKWTIQNEANNKYVAATYATGTDGKYHLNFAYVNEAFNWDYDTENGFFHAVLKDENGTDMNVFLGGRGTYDTISVYTYKTVDDAKAMWALRPYTFKEGYQEITEFFSKTAYKFGAARKDGVVYIATGEMSGFYGASTTENSAGADVIPQRTDNGVTLQVESTGKYIGATVSGTHYNYVYQDEAYYWDYDETENMFTTTLGEGESAVEVYVGFSGDKYTTFGVYVIGEEGLGETDYPAHLYTGYFIPEDEAPMTEGPIATTPTSGTAKKFGVHNTSKSIDGYLLMTGSMDGYYYGTVKVTNTEEWEEAADILPTKNADGTWTLRVGSAGKYLGAERALGDDDKMHNNILLVDTAFNWQYDETENVFHATLGEGEDAKHVFIGSSGTYDTISLQYWDTLSDSDAYKATFFDWGEYEIVDEPDEPVDTYEPTGTPVTLDFTKTEFTTASDNVSLSLTEVTINYEGLNFAWTKADSRSDIALNDEGTGLKYTAPARFYVKHAWKVTAPTGYAISAVVADAVDGNLFDDEHVEVTAPTNAVFHHDTEIELPTPVSTFECNFKVQTRANTVSFYLVPLTAA